MLTPARKSTMPWERVLRNSLLLPASRACP